MANEIEFKVKLTEEKMKDFFGPEAADKWSWYELAVTGGGIRNDFYYAPVAMKDEIKKLLKEKKTPKVPVKRIRYEGDLKNAGKNRASQKFLFSDDFDPNQSGLTPGEVLYTEKVRRVNNGIETNDEYEVSGTEAAPKIKEVKDESKYFCWFNKQKKYLRVCTKTNKNVHLEFVNVNGLLYLESEICGTSGTEENRLKALEDLVKNLGFNLNDRDGTPWVTLLADVK